MKTSDLSCDSAALWTSYVDEAYVRDVRTYVSRVIAPEADRIDRDDVYPVAIMKDLAKQGYSAVAMEASLGGRGLSYQHAVAVCEEVAVASAAVGVSLITIFQAQTMIRLFGAESLKQRYLPAIAGGLLCSYALTEANHGSDIRTLDTKARLQDGQWVVLIE